MSTFPALDADGNRVDVELPMSVENNALLTDHSTKLDTLHDDITTLQALVDGIEPSLTSLNTKVDTLNAEVADTSDSPVAPHQPCVSLSLTPTLDTSIYASGDVLFATTALANAARANDKCFQIQSVQVVDKDDQKPAMRLFYFSANVSFGTINSTPSISDSDAANYLGHIDVAASDYIDLGGVSVASLTPACGTAWRVGPMKPVSGGTTIYVVAMLTAGTPTHTASGIVLNHGVVQA